MDGRQPPLPDFTLLPSALTLPTKVPTLRGSGRSGVVILLQIPINQLLADTFHDLANTSAGRGPRAASSEQEPTTSASDNQRTTSSLLHSFRRVRPDTRKWPRQQASGLAAWMRDILEPGKADGTRGLFLGGLLASSCRGKRSRGYFLQLLGAGGGSIFVPYTLLPTSMF